MNLDFNRVADYDYLQSLSCQCYYKGYISNLGGEYMSYYQLQLHPVWEEKLPEEEILAYKKLAETQTINNGITNTVVRATYKKNGGFSATLLINNGLNQQLALEDVKVTVLDAKSEVIADATFSPNLHIDAYHSQPWSFVFSKDTVQRYDADLQHWSVQLHTNI